jgi:hypothetical protein
MKIFIVGVMALLVVGVIWEIFSGFSKKLLSKDLNRIKQQGHLNINRSWFHRIEKLPMLLITFLLFYIQFKIIWFIHTAIYPVDMSYSYAKFINQTFVNNPDAHRLLNVLLMISPGLLSSMCISMIFINLIEWSIPSLRRSSKANTGLTFQEAMPAVIGITLLIVPACLFFQLLGAIL